MQNLIDVIKKYESAVIGFSGGVDSSLLLYAAKRANIRVKAITFHSMFYPEIELDKAKDFAKKLDINHEIILFNPLEIENLNNNPKNRCYICKKDIFFKLREIADKENYKAIFDGSNIDDLKDYRPGFKAVEEIGAVSPLIEAKLNKENIRKLLKDNGFEIWNKPSFACYFSRFPYDSNITKEKVMQINFAETEIHNLGLISARVRYHNEVARIEMNNDDFIKCATDSIIREKIIKVVKKSGFLYVALDLEGYTTGSMNKMIEV